MVRKSFRKVGVLSVALSLAVLALAACGKSTSTGGSPSPSGNATSSVAPSGTKTTIVLQTFLKPDGTSSREKALAQIVKNFTEKTGIEVKYAVFPWQEVDTRLMLSVQSDNPPDVSYVRDRSFEKHMRAGSLLPLDDFIKADMTEKDKNDFLLWDKVGVKDGRKYTFPTSFIVDALFIRKDLLEKAGLEPPKTWDDFIKVGKALTTQSVSGFLIGASPVQANQLDFLQSIIEGRGGKVLDETGKAAFDGPAGVETFKFLKSLVYEHKIMPASAATTKYDDVTDSFASGRVAMIFEGSHRYAQVAQALKPENVLVTKFPNVNPDKPSPAGVNGWTIGIPKNSKHPKEAWEFIKFFTSAESNLLYTKISGELPIRKSVLNDDYFKSDQAAMVRWYVDYLNENSTMAVAPATANELNEIVAQALQAILIDPNSDVEKILKDAAKKYNDLAK